MPAAPDRSLCSRDCRALRAAVSLSAEKVEQLGETFMLLERRMQELKDAFGLEDEDLNLDLGPLGKLI